MKSKKVKVIGAGFTGLTSAYYLHQAGFEVEVFEKETKIGGLIHTVETPWGLVETAANGILNSVKLEQLARELNLVLSPTRRESRKRFIFRGRPRLWPLSPLETSAMAIQFARARPRKPTQGETIAMWGRRVLGERATSYLLAPALQGIYAGNPSTLSANLILSRFFNRKKKPRPLTKGTVAPSMGMGALLKALFTHLEQSGVKFTFGEDYKIQNTTDYQILCTGANSAGWLLSDASRELSLALRAVPLLPLVSVTAFFSLAGPEGLVGFGCLFPRDQGFRALGALLNHNIFDNRSPHRSETWIYGGAIDPEAVDLNDRDLLALLLSERKRLHNLEKSEQPLGYRVQRWKTAFPHYTVELEHLLRSHELSIRTLEKNGIYLMGNYTGTIGLSQILEKASELPGIIARGASVRD